MQEIVYSLKRSWIQQGHVLKIAGQTTNSHHAELEAWFSETPSTESGSESTGDESDDCWIHMLKYNPPRWSNSS